MKAIKYLLVAALFVSGSAAVMAQDIKSDIAKVTKVIVDSKADPATIKDPVKDFLKQYKKNAQGLTGLASAFFNAGDTANAQKYANMAITRDKHYGDAYCLLGDMAAMADDGGAAAMWYQNAQTMDPKNPKGYIKYAAVYRGRSPEESLQSLEKLRQIMPDYPVDAEAAHFFYGARKYDRACIFFDKVGLDKLSKDQLREFSLAGYFSGNTAKSLDVAKYGAEKFPRDPVMNRMAFYNSLAAKDYPNAISYAQRLFTASDSAKIIARDYINAGHAYVGNKDFTNAIEMYKKALEIEPASQTHKFLSDAYSEAGDVDNALTEYNNYVSKKENPSAQDYMSLATIYTNAADKVTGAKQAEYQREADKVYGTIIEKFPSYAGYATYMRAVINWNLDPDYKGLAKPYFESLINIVKSHTAPGSNDKAYLKQAYSYLGAYYYTAGDKTKGEEMMRSLLEVDPDNANAKAALGIK